LLVAGWYGLAISVVSSLLGVVGIPMTDQRDPAATAASGVTVDGTPARIGIQSADRLRRESLAGYLDTLPHFTVVGRVARYEHVVSLCALERPAIVLLDAGRDVHDAVAGCRLIRDRCPDVCLAVTYERLTPPELSALRVAGVDALVPYGHGLAAVVAVLRKLAAGMSTSYPPNTGLSGRQREILLLLASGHNATEIGELLGISPGTVESHKRKVYAKLGAASALQAVARAASYGTIDGERVVTPPAGAEADSLPAPAAGWVPAAEAGRTLLTVVTGGDSETIDRVVATLVAHRLPVIRDTAPSWIEPLHGLRWHRGQFARVLVDPAPEHWRVAAGCWRYTVVVRSGRHPVSATATFANGGGALLQADHIEDRLVSVLTLVTQGYLVMDRSAARSFAHTAPLRFAGREPQKPTLTAREYDILVSIGRSLTVRQTARRLGIAVKTVENTQVHLFRKLGVHNRAEALAAAYSLGLLRPDATP
jgi:DNA-binding NarL/FixJ family response regulator